MNRITTLVALAVTITSGAASACAPAPASSEEATPMKNEMTLESHAFAEGEAIPRKYTCEGEDVSPPLSWSNLPERTRTLALIVDDPDAPDPKAPKRTWVHWVLYEIPVEVTELPEGALPLPVGAREGVNDWGKTGYGGPCPPIGTHRYFFKLYALDTALGDLSAPTKARLEQAMTGHILAQTELIGTYRKKHE
jgi:Raf kinase inhibitor-like YbhB/YbcL family protein